MSIRPPRLDDRTYDDFVEELLARIPAHTPEWTNPRPGDPGRTLIELFAWLGDALLYRANLIPERQRLAFLRLLGSPLRPSRPARGLVTISFKENEPVKALPIPPQASLKGPVTFEARDEFTVLPVTGAAYYKRTTEENELAPELHSALSQFHAGGGDIIPYFNTPLFSGGQPLKKGFDIVADSADGRLWIALFAPQARPEAQKAKNDATRLALDRKLLNVGFIPALPSTDPLEPAAARARVPHVWEMTVNTTSTKVDERGAPEYLALDEVVDTTAGLTRPGIVRLSLPREDIIHAPTNDVRANPNAGVGDRPPRLDDPALGSRLVAWIRLRPAPPPAPVPAPETRFVTTQGSESMQSSQTGAVPSPRAVTHLRLVWAGVNAIEVEQLITRSNLIIGESNATADQEFLLPVASIEPESLVIEVEEESGWVPWTRVEDLAALDRSSGKSRDARVFQLDATAGTVLLGDGMNGRIPAAGRRIRARQIRSGGGVAGNLPAGTLKAISATLPNGESEGKGLVVTQPMAFDGGADAETLREAERRIPSRLRHRERAVTADDYRALALETPGIAVGRVEILPRFKPHQRREDIPGIVTVLALPERPLAPPPNPRADRPFLEALYAWLDARRPVATELYVIGCEYVPVAVSVALTVAEGAQPDTTVQSVKEALRRTLWPLAGGGFHQKGWPLGRALSNRELAVEVARVEGVSEVAGLNLFRRNSSSGVWERLGDSRDGVEQNLALKHWQLPELSVILVVADGTATGAPLSIIEPVSSSADPNADSVGTSGGTDPTEGPGGSGRRPAPTRVPLAVPAVPDVC